VIIRPPSSSRKVSIFRALIEAAENKAKPDLSFGKGYKLCSRKRISEIFKDAQIVKNFPIRVLWQCTTLDKNDEEPVIQAVFSVPKRLFKKAHDRNLIKRRMRESFRKNRLSMEHILLNKKKRMYLFIVYQENKILDFELIEKKMRSAINQLIKTQES